MSATILRGDGRTLSDGNTYRVSYMGHGSGYELHTENRAGDAFEFCGRVYPLDNEEDAIVASVEALIAQRYED